MPHLLRDFPGASVIKNLPANAGDSGDEVSIPGSGISPERGNGNPLQYSCHGPRSLAGYSLASLKRLDTTKRTLHTWTHSWNSVVGTCTDSETE